MRAKQEIDENCIFAKSRKHQLGNIFADFTFNEILRGLGRIPKPHFNAKNRFRFKGIQNLRFF